jgi:hypothetical protein
MEREVTARRNARWEPGTGAKIFRPLVFLAEPHEPSGFCLSKRKLHPLSKLALISETEESPWGELVLELLSDLLDPKFSSDKAKGKATRQRNERNRIERL